MITVQVSMILFVIGVSVVFLGIEVAYLILSKWRPEIFARNSISYHPDWFETTDGPKFKVIATYDHYILLQRTKKYMNPKRKKSIWLTTEPPKMVPQEHASAYGIDLRSFV